MEQFVLYLAVLAALAGFGMGLLNLAGPFLRRRNLSLPRLNIAALLRRGDTEEDDLDFVDDDDLDTARDFAESGFAAGDTSLLTPRLTVVDDEELDEELVQVLDEVAAEQPEPVEGDAESEDGDNQGPVIYTISAEADDEAEDDEAENEDAAEEASDEESIGEENEDTEEDGDDFEEGEEEEESAAEAPQVQVVAAAAEGGDDMLSFFSESADAGKAAVAAWREDLPDVSIEELLAEARALSQQIKGNKRNAA
jgi:hypothetical protein